MSKETMMHCVEDVDYDPVLHKIDGWELCVNLYGLSITNNDDVVIELNIQKFNGTFQHSGMKLQHARKLPSEMLTFINDRLASLYAIEISIRRAREAHHIIKGV